MKQLGDRTTPKFEIYFHPIHQFEKKA
jgi:hypothetical protein